jgi:hypothetical protein
MPEFSIRQNDLLDPIRSVLKDANGAIVDLTLATGVKFQMSVLNADGTLGASKVNAAATIDSPATAGAVRYNWAVGDTDTAGNFAATWQVTWPSGKPQTFPTVTNQTVLIAPDLGP